MIVKLTNCDGNQFFVCDEDVSAVYDVCGLKLGEVRATTVVLTNGASLVITGLAACEVAKEFRWDTDETEEEQNDPN